MVNEEVLNKDVIVFGLSLPRLALTQDDIDYLRTLHNDNLPDVEWLWKEMDRVWDVLKLNNKVALEKQRISDFYSHPVWVLNGVFSAVDPVSVKHRESIAAFIRGINVKRVADYGGGFGELALKVHDVAPDVKIDIVEPYISKLGKARLEGHAKIDLLDNLEQHYDCVIAQDVLEHVEYPLSLTKKLVNSTKLGGYLIFANCFCPVIKCHLPSTFYLRHTFKLVVKGMGLKFDGRVDGVPHALVFKKVGKIDDNKLTLLTLFSKLIGPFLNLIAHIFSVIKNNMKKKSSWMS